MRGFIKSLRLNADAGEKSGYPFDLPAVRALDALCFDAPVTFFIGENGTGKSTVLEAAAVNLGFNPEGGTKNFSFSTRESHSPLAEHITVVKAPRRPKDGFFLRAESFYNVATEIERMDAVPGFAPPVAKAYGPRPLHGQSHGESFMALFENRFRSDGLYLFDEPEAALSPARQLELLARIDGLVKRGSQFVVATHSPFLPAYPGAGIYVFSERGIEKTRYEDTVHYAVTKRFINDPQGYLKLLLG